MLNPEFNFLLFEVKRRKKTFLLDSISPSTGIWWLEKIILKVELGPSKMINLSQQVSVKKTKSSATSLKNDGSKKNETKRYNNFFYKTNFTIDIDMYLGHWRI